MEMQVKTEVDECMISDANRTFYDDHISNSVKPEPGSGINIAVKSEHSHCRTTVKREDPGEIHSSEKKPECRVVDVMVKPENGVPLDDDDMTENCTETLARCDSTLKLEHTEHGVSPSVDISSAGRICNENEPRTEKQENQKNKSTKGCRKIKQSAHRGKQKPKLFHCEICGKDIKHILNFQEHQRMHNNERPYECPLCHKTFIRCADLIKHRLVHSDLRPHACPVCGKRFKLQGDVAKHQAVHKAVYPFSCASCGQSFKRLACLNKHARVHSAETPYRCPTCARCFKWESSLTEHLRAHSGERPFVCEEDGCGKSFARRSIFLQHREAHRHPRQFRCPHCGKAFNYRTNLRRHERLCCPEAPGPRGAEPRAQRCPASRGKLKVGHQK